MNTFSSTFDLKWNSRARTKEVSSVTHHLVGLLVPHLGGTQVMDDFEDFYKRDHHRQLQQNRRLHRNLHLDLQSRSMTREHSILREQRETQIR
jgi:hypothetical protein